MTPWPTRSAAPSDAQDAPAIDSPSSIVETFARFAPPFVVLVAAVRMFYLTKDYGLMGWDSYPLIIASRIGSVGDLIGTFTERLMDGRYAGEFYRPLLNLSFALDHAVWGLDPVGYQLTGVLAFAGSGLAVWLMARRLAGAALPFVPLLATVIFLTHPLIFEVLPVPPRRPELLCAMFMGLALWLQLSPRALDSHWPPMLPAVATLLAIATKETGFILPALVFLAVALASPRVPFVGRMVHAAACLVPHVVVVVIMLIARFAVLGGLGGQGNVSFGFVDATRFLGLVAVRLVATQPEQIQTMPVRWAPVAVSIVAVVVAAVFAGRRGDASIAGARRLALVGATWLVLTTAASYAAGNWIAESYFLMPLIGWAMVAAAACGVLARTVLGGSRRALAGGALGLLALPLLWQAAYSPMVRHYDDWSRATEMQRTFLESTREQIADAADGTIVYPNAVPLTVPSRASGPRVRGTAILAGYSVQAWAELVFPERKVRVVAVRGVVEGPFSGEVLVLLTSFAGF